MNVSSGPIHLRCVKAAVTFSALFLAINVGRATALEVRKGDHICLVGNALGERLQFANDWEALLYRRFPRHELVVRNLCFPADEPFHRDRSLNFGTPDAHLTHSKADVILYFFGMNEAFAGQAGLESFRTDLRRLVDETKTRDYSGKGAPRIVLVSPIAHEDLGDPNITKGVEHNAELSRYTAAIREVAAAAGVGFVDLLEPTKALFEATDQNLTINGVHLSTEGYARLAPLFDRALFGEPPADRPATPPDRLKAEIDDKNFHWWHRYRAVNGYSIYGTRGEAGSDGTYRNREVMERERAILDEMCANRDQRIWKLAQGQDVPPQADDSNTLPFFNPKTNVGGTIDPNRKAGKLGSLDYLPAAEQAKTFQLPPGYEINLFASEEEFPELAKPVALNFDSRGRMWVSTMPSYPQWQPKTKLDDRLLILEDGDRDGRADHCKVFAGGLHQPTGFEIGAGGAFVCQGPDLLYLKDTDGDDQADVRIRRVTGFDTADSHHGLAAFEWGPDGALYFQEGTFKQSQVESPYGPVRLGDAGIWRYEPRTERFEVHASLAFANPWGHVFDRWGQNFLSDASPGYNYWATPISGRVEFPDKHPGGSRAGHLDWGGSRGKGDYPVFVEKRVRPTSGCEFISSRNFPPEVQGNFLVNNVIGDLAVLQHTVFDQGSGFGGKEVTPLVRSDHGNFRPVDLQFGPDGALYIVDWHNALIGHLQHNLRDPSRDHSHGRIWRVVYKDRPLVQPPTIAGAPVPALLDLLKEPEDRTRYRVRREIADRKTGDVLPALETWVAAIEDQPAADREHLLLEGLWVHQTHNVVNPNLLARLLDSPEPRARAAATRVLCEWRDRVPSSFNLLAARVRDAHPRVRLEAVRALSFVPTPASIEAALDVLNYEMDPFLDYTLGETVRSIESVLARPGSRTTTASADPGAHHEHGQGHAPGNDQAAAPRPLVFLDKTPAIVRYQLDRLSPAQLLLVAPTANDPRSVPVFAAVLARPGLSIQDRQHALDALVALNRTEPIKELTTAIGGLDVTKLPQKGVAEHLSTLLMKQPVEAITRRLDVLRESINSRNAGVRAVGYAGLVAARQADSAWAAASRSTQGRLDFLAGIRLVPARPARAALRDEVLSCLANTQPIEVRRAAIEAVSSIPAEPAENFHIVAGLIAEPPLRASAVATLGRIPREFRSAADVRQVVGSLVKYAETTPAARRTTDEFLDAMHLTDDLLALLPVGEVRGFRDRLRAVTVRVVRINTVHEEMRYDTPYFAVEAGRPVQVVLRNEDLMPHNLVITVPGALREVADLAASMPPQAVKDGKPYVPDSKSVLFATRMVDPHRQDVLTFTAPQQPGEYPYVCTFPNHWMRMYGVMVVVEDLDSWLASPVKPTDPIGLTREVVKSWTIEDFPDDLVSAVRNRSSEIGRQIFKEATCLQCHKMSGEGGSVGPDLTDVLPRWKGDILGVLREVIEPSHKIDPKYALYNIVTRDGRVISGVVTDQNAETITVVSDPANPKPVVMPRDDIEEMGKTSSSLMPKGLLDRYTRDEVLELMKFLISGTGAPATSPPASR